MSVKPRDGLLYHSEAFESVPPQERRRLLAKTEWLWANRKVLKHTPLRADLSPFLRWRTGDYRIVYASDHVSDDLIIYLVAPRRDVYQQARRLRR